MLQITKEDLLPLFEAAFEKAEALDIDLEEQDLQFDVNYLRGFAVLSTENPNYNQYADDDESEMIMLVSAEVESWKAEYMKDEPSLNEEEFFDAIKAAANDVLEAVEDDVDLYSLIVRVDGFEDVDLTEEEADDDDNAPAIGGAAQTQAMAMMEQQLEMYKNMPGVDIEQMRKSMQMQMEMQMAAMGSVLSDDDDSDDAIMNITYSGQSTLTAEQKAKLAYGAPLSVMYYHPCDATETGEDADIIREQLESWWDISDEQSANDTLLWLLNEGHSTMRDQVIDLIYDEQVPWNKRVIAIHSVVEDRDQAIEMENHYYNIMKMIRYVEKRGFKSVPRIPKSIVAWDYARCISIARTACDAGYISNERMWQFIDAVAERAAGQFSSWEEYGASFAFGRGIWRYDNDDLKAGDMVIRSLIDAEGDSPWK